VSTVLIILAIAAGYAAFRLVKPDKACWKCSGWGQKTRRRRTSACSRCGGTGKTFPLAGRLVHMGTAAAMRRWRERAEEGR
jgi:DnaJ-class molecular chaperone